jgi:hypothetical protein
MSYSQASPSRIECLDKLGINVTREALDACEGGDNTTTKQNLKTTSINTSNEELICTDIGFKKKTEGFASCVLELIERKDSKQQNSLNSNDPDDATCQKYGFKPRTNEYANCKQQIDLVKQQARQQQVQYDEQKRQYDVQVEEYKRKQQQAASMALMQCGLNMMSTGNCSGVRNIGPAPVAPLQPSYVPRTYYLPGNKVMTCSTMGNVTTCN